jgi:tetratricopeptide (TPR) repeat protein
MAHSKAMENFERALLHDPDYPPANIGLACTLLTSPAQETPHSAMARAEVHLDSVTKYSSGDNSEAWYWLGEIYEKYGMLEKAAECWLHCEELERRKPIRDWDCVKPQWI